jgi:hypothetical protein
MTTEIPTPFTEDNIQMLLHDYAWHRKTLEQVASMLNSIAEEFYKHRITEKGVISPYDKASSRHKLLALEVGESIYTEDEYYKNRTRIHGFNLSKSHGMKFSTLRRADGWRTWRIK